MSEFEENTETPTLKVSDEMRGIKAPGFKWTQDPVVAFLCGSKHTRVSRKRKRTMRAEYGGRSVFFGFGETLINDPAITGLPYEKITMNVIVE